jgi:hypothetical protein
VLAGYIAAAAWVSTLLFAMRPTYHTQEPIAAPGEKS